MTLELRISGETVTAQCVAEALRRLGVEASVAPTTNVCKSPDGSFCIEPGAHVLLLDCDRAAFSSSVWPSLKSTFSLRCGWVDASTKGFRGCTANYCADSTCPGRIANEFEDCARCSAAPILQPDLALR